VTEMLPPFYGEDIKSNAEKSIFDHLRTDPDTKGWVCLHSLGMARHRKQIYGEIDFVVLVPDEGVFCLEVKGGDISREGGLWTFTNRYGDRNRREKSPFMQARENMFSLIEVVQREFGASHRLSHLLYGWGVLFPDIPWTRQDPEAHPWQIYDRDFRRPISAFLRQVARETRQDLPNRRAPTAQDLKELTAFLRGDFDIVEAPEHRIAAMDDRIRRLTEQQFQCLDRLSRNPRCLLEGGAGTGKTFLAMELARRGQRAGNRVLLLCFNRLLGAWLSSSLPATKYSHVTSGHLHGLIERIVLASSLRDEFVAARQNCATRTAKRNFFQEEAPVFAQLALAEGVLQPFDQLIMDEGQDLLTPAFLDVLDALVVGGLAAGRWAIFCDLHRQAIYQDDGPSPPGDAAERLRELIMERASHHAAYELSMNCRNTQPIGEETALLSGFAVPPFLPSNVEGAAVEYLFYADPEEQRRRLVALLNTLKQDGVPARAIHILAPVTRDQSVLAQLGEQTAFPIVDLNDRAIARPPDAAGFTTIQAYKGLENAVVILTDIRRLTSDRDKALLYVGMSRARQRLFVLMDEQAHAAYDRAVRENFLRGQLPHESY